MLSFIDYHKRKLIYSLLLIYWLFILLLTSLPAGNMPNVQINDKVIHFIAFMLLGFLLRSALRIQGKVGFVKKYSFAVSITIISIYALLDELHQMYIPGRSCDPKDWLADICGAFLGIIIVTAIRKFVHKYKQETV